MSRVKDMTGITINNLKVIKRIENYKDGKAQWLVECRCGNEFKAIGKYLRNGSIKSCGCLKSKRMTEYGKAKATHGDSKSRLFSIWSGMKKRCYYKKNIGYKNYGGRGIQVCDEWKNNYSAFKLWAMNNGYDESLTLDRIDTNKDYCPDNCKWSTVTEQNRNKRNNKLFNYNGKVLTQSEICEITGLSKHQVNKEFSNESAKGEKGFETYVHGVFAQSLIYSIVGALLLCLATTLIVVGWKLFTKKVYVTVPEREEFSFFEENKKRIIPEHQKRDDDAEERNLYIAGTMGIVSMFLTLFGIVFVIANITGVFAPDYVAIKEIVESIGGN